MLVGPVLSQHTEDAAFHWLLRDAAVRAPHYSLADLAKLDDRLDAHLDGLRIAGDDGWQVVKEELAWEEAGEVFTGLVLAVPSGDPLRIEEVLAVADQSLELARGAISALGWLPWEQVQPVQRQLFNSDNAVRRRILVGSFAVHRADPGAGLARLLADADPLVRSRALKAVGELGRTDLLAHCMKELESEDEGCRYWAAWSGMLLGVPAAGAALQAFVVPSHPRAEEAAELIARRLPPGQSVAWQRQLAAQPELLRIAVKVAGATGEPALIPWLIEAMIVPDVARAAGEAVSMITGIDIAFEDLDADEPAGVEAGPTEEAEDENVALDDDEDLAWPHVERLRSWWSGNSGRFPGGTRHLAGRPISANGAIDVLRHGMQRQRRAAALELVALTPGQPLFEARSRGGRQRALLG
jgi:uncharacterized protein (TIGR02270 family)